MPDPSKLSSSSPRTERDVDSKLGDDLRKSSARICAHMNKDHTASVLAYAHWYARRPQAREALLVEITPKGFVLEILEEGVGHPDDAATAKTSSTTARTRVVVPYPSPLVSAGAIRKLAVAMHFEAFRELGLLYKLRHGYFQDAALQAARHMPLPVLVPVSLLPFLILCGVLSADTMTSLRVAPFMVVTLCFLCDAVFEPRVLAELRRRHGVAPFPKRPFSLKQVFHTCIVAVLAVWCVIRVQRHPATRQPEASFRCVFPGGGGKGGDDFISRVTPRITLGWELYDIFSGMAMRWRYYWWHRRNHAGSNLRHKRGDSDDRPRPVRCSVGGVGGLHAFIVTGLLLYMEYRGIAPVVVFGLVMEVSSVFLSLRALDFTAVSRHANAVLDGLFAITFIGIRLVLVPAWAFQFLIIGWFPEGGRGLLDGETGDTIREADWGACMNRGVLWSATFAAAVLCAMNAWWGSTIAAKLWELIVGKVLSGGEAKKGKEVDSEMMLRRLAMEEEKSF